MLDIRLLREEPDRVRRALVLRNTEAPLDEAIEADAERREVLAEVEGLRAEKNTISKEIGELSRAMKGTDTKEAKHAEHRRSDLMSRSSFIGDKLDSLEERLGALSEKLRAALLEIPNIPDDSVPEGSDESSNVLVRQSGEPKPLGFEARPHWELGESLGIIDFERGVKLAGSRFYVLRGAGARLWRTLIAWMLDFQSCRGYNETTLRAVTNEKRHMGGCGVQKLA